jgi:internalin A
MSKIEVNKQDIETIRLIEENLSIKLEKISEIYWKSRGYTLNQKGKIIGIGLNYFKIKNPERIILALKKLENLIALDLSSNQISDISQLKELTGLKILYLSYNQISDISKLKELKRLAVLDLSYNQIDDISALKELTSLKTLYLSYNQIKDITPLNKLKNLNELYLKDNQISDISSLKDLKRINELYLNDNQISDISSLKKLTNLTTLFLNNNQINDLSALKELRNLYCMDLRRNPIKNLPTWIMDFDLDIQWKDGLFLGCISFFDNPLNYPPIEIMKQGQDAIRNYFVQIEKETDYLFEAKLLFVGTGEVGKTWLLNRIIYDRIPTNNETTEGIDITKWFVKTTVCDKFRINNWDFGGQEIYHATHQFFLTKRSLYLFVWEARKDEDIMMFDYWLNVIKLLSNSAPVIIVLNKCDERSKAIEEKTLKEKFSNIKAFFKVSAKDGTGIEDLRNEIKKQIVALPHIGQELPKAWLTIREELEGSEKDFIFKDEYITICNKHGLKEEQALYLSDYYHDLGVFLHFRDNAVLDNIVFLKPEWATNAVYRIIDTKTIKENAGNFEFTELKEIWKEYNESKFLYLIELMKKFELCFQLGNTSSYIVPELLPAECKDLEWDYYDNLCFEYHYAFMPAGIITRFTVRKHTWIKGKLFWTQGVMLHHDGTEALLISEKINKKLRILLRGKEKKELLYYIRCEVDDIHKSLNNPDVKEMLPCICKECTDSKNPRFHDYRNIIKFKYEKNISTVQCPYSGENVYIEKMLDGIERKEERNEKTNIINNIYIEGDNNEILQDVFKSNVGIHKKKK